MSSGRRSRDDGDDNGDAPPRTRARITSDPHPAPHPALRLSLLDDVEFERITSANTWQELFQVEPYASGEDEAVYASALAKRNALLRIAHPDKVRCDQDRAHEATTIINAMWEQVPGPRPQPQPGDAGERGGGGAAHTALGLTQDASSNLGAPSNLLLGSPGAASAASLPVAASGSIQLLEDSSRMQPPASPTAPPRPPTLLKGARGDMYVGFGTMQTLQGCRFLPMPTNRCVSQDVVAQRVTQNLVHLQRHGCYCDFGQISAVAVRTPTSEQFVEEQDGSSGSKRRYARFYVLDGQHRLMAMTELSKECPNVPISFQLSVRVVDTKQQANEALLHMQNTYRPDPKCFFEHDNEAEIAGQVLDLAKLRWPKAFVATHNQSFASKVKPTNRPYLHDGLFFDLLRDTHLLRRANTLFLSSPPLSDTSLSYSTTYASDPPGQGHGRGGLRSPQAWSAQHNRAGEWVCVDLGAVHQVAGVVTQGRAGSAQRVTGYRVDVSCNGVAWESVDDGAEFEGNAAGASAEEERERVFRGPHAARFVKIIVERWEEHISMRVGVLLPDASHNADRAARLFQDLVSVNTKLKSIALKQIKAGKLKLSESTISKTCDKTLQGCFLGVYQRDQTSDASLLLEELIAANVIPSSAEIKDDV